MKLYSYWRSTTSYRVRVALHLKGIPFETIPVNLIEGEQRSATFSQVNPSGGVPVLELQDGTRLTQSLAILDYLDTIAAPKLVPADPLLAAQVRAAAQIIALDIHPVNNLKVVGMLPDADADAKVSWMLHWMHEGFNAFSQAIHNKDKYCFGDTVTIADICLVGQLINAHRWGLDLSPYPRLTEIETNCLALPAFQAAAPDAQPDATT